LSTAALLESESTPRGARLVADPRDTVPVGLQMRVETPENVVLAYQLAGPAPRAVAYAIDFALRVVFFFILSAILSVGMMWLPGLSMGLILFGLFLLEWGYFVVCEGFFNGRTIGKAMMKLRVIQEKGYAVTMWSVLLRNLLRAADYMLFLAPAFLSMLLTRRFQRLGDLVAHTVVVSERVVQLPREPVIVERIAPLRRDEIGSFVPSRETLALIDEFLSRRAPSRIPPERGHRIVSRFARVLAKRLNYQGDRERLEKYPMAFLAQVFVTFTRRDEEEENEPGGRRQGAGSRRRGAGGRGRDDVEEVDVEVVFEPDDVPKGDPNDLDEIVARDAERARRRRTARRARSRSALSAANAEDEDEDGDADEDEVDDAADHLEDDR
jgi:uncharacterized RDD family membrane protein YckC